jgi:hypothetical protein
MLASVILAVLAATSRVAQSPLPAGAATIVNSGSTNAPGYRIVVRPDGTAILLDTTTVRQVPLPPATARAFFHDLSSASPLRTLPASGCMKSASFGTTTRVVWRGQSTPDLSCPSTNPALLRLNHDVSVIGARVWDRRLHTLPIARRRLPEP